MFDSFFSPFNNRILIGCICLRFSEYSMYVLAFPNGVVIPICNNILQLLPLDICLNKIRKKRGF